MYCSNSLEIIEFFLMNVCIKLERLSLWHRGKWLFGLGGALLLLTPFTGSGSMNNLDLPGSIRQQQSYPPAWPWDVGCFSCFSFAPLAIELHGWKGQCSGWAWAQLGHVGPFPTVGFWSFSVCSKLLFLCWLGIFG